MTKTAVKIYSKWEQEAEKSGTQEKHFAVSFEINPQGSNQEQ